MGAVINMRPDLFNSAILGVPFVDCLTTMLDETIPLTGGSCPPACLALTARLAHCMPASMPCPPALAASLPAACFPLVL